MDADEHPELQRAADDRLVVHLLDSPSVGVAAALAGISEKKAQERLADPAFIARLRSARQQAYAAAIAAAQGAGVESVEVLREIAANPFQPAPSRVRASLGILALAQRELEKSAVESALEGEKAKQDALIRGDREAFLQAGGDEISFMLETMD